MLDGSILSKLTKFGLKLSNYIYETVSNVKNNVDLLESQQLLVSNFLSKRKIVVYIDDLDRGWEGKPDDISRISAGISFKVSLRSDVYYLVRTSDESTDKIESSVVWCEWSNHGILVLLVKRILTFFDIPADYDNLLKTDQFYLSQHLDRVFERRFQGRGKWSDTYTY